MTRRRAEALVVAAIALAPVVLGDYRAQLLCDVGTSALVALGLVLLAGVGRLTSFGQAAFVGVGAYATAVWTTRPDLVPGFPSALHDPWMGLLLALALGGVVAAALGAITLRLSGHYLPLGTLAWGIALYILFGNLEPLGGHTGLGGVPPIALAGLRLDGPRPMVPLVWLVLAAAVATSRNLLDSRAGRALRALGGGRILAEAMGVDASRARATLFVLAALQAATAGWLYAHLQRFVNPTPFGLHAGIEYLAMAVLGGVGHVEGAVLGAAVVTVVVHLLRELAPLVGRSGEPELLLFGVAVVVLLQRAPEGLWPAVARRLRASDAAPPADPAAPAPPRRAATPRGDLLLEVRDVTKRFGGVAACDGMGLSVRSGEIVALIGPNGAGKSTLFDVVTGIARPDRGEVLVRGASVRGRGPRAIARRGVSRTFQHVRLLPRMSVVENAALGAHPRGRRGALAASFRLDRREERLLLGEAARQVQRVGLGDRLAQPAGTLPLGSQRLLEIARALCADPLLLLLDEPAAGLRHQERRRLSQLLRALRTEGLGILLVEHDVDLVMDVADRVVVMDFGRKLVEGRPEEVRRDARVVDAYLGGAA